MSFEIYKGKIAPLPNDNIDTDQLIPKAFLKSTEKKGYGIHLFEEWRYREDGTENPDFVLNDPNYRDASILVAGNNFGCGSSREHAAWALEDFGFHVIIAGSFSPIFYMNWLNNGHWPIVLSEKALAELQAMGPSTIEVDLLHGEVRAGERMYPFTIESSWRERLLKGIDGIGLTLEREDKISAYEEKRGYKIDGGILE